MGMFNYAFEHNMDLSELHDEFGETFAVNLGLPFGGWHLAISTGADARDVLNSGNERFSAAWPGAQLLLRPSCAFSSWSGCAALHRTGAHGRPCPSIWDTSPPPCAYFSCVARAVYGYHARFCSEGGSRPPPSMFTSTAVVGNRLDQG